MSYLTELPTGTQAHVDAFVEAARAAWGRDLRAALLYGPAADGILRPGAEVNLLLVLTRFTREQADKVREPFGAAHKAVRLDVMFLLESELETATAAFAVKFLDILTRRRVLYGEDPFAALAVSRPLAIVRLKHLLLHLRLRLRERYALDGVREERLAAVVADASGPLRACAAALLKLEGRAADTPKAALKQVAMELREHRFETLLISISDAREKNLLPPGTAEETFFTLMDLVEHIQARAERLPETL